MRRSKQYTHLAMTTPAVRMVVVAAYAYENPDGTIDVDFETFPVIALAGEIDAEDNWPYYHALVCDGEDGIVSSRKLGEAKNVAVETVACPWPESEDGNRLNVVHEGLRESLIERYAFRKGRRPHPNHPADFAAINPVDGTMLSPAQAPPEQPSS